MHFVRPSLPSQCQHISNSQTISWYPRLLWCMEGECFSVVTWHAHLERGWSMGNLAEGTAIECHGVDGLFQGLLANPQLSSQRHIQQSRWGSWLCDPVLSSGIEPGLRVERAYQNSWSGSPAPSEWLVSPVFFFLGPWGEQGDPGPPAHP